jgi:uncharacterized lipoprotein YddW (UPF0748 family)
MEVSAITKLCVLLSALALPLAFAAACHADQPPEFRGMWVSSYGNEMTSPEAIDSLIQHAKLANINALVVQVRKLGDAHYNSHYEPRAENLTLADFDPLAYLIPKAREAGIEVHAWMNTYKVWQGRARPKSANHVFNTHPEWVNRTINGTLDKSGNYGLDPGIREVQQYTYDVYMDVVKNYDVDGVHFDYVRYWDPQFGYTDLAVKRFNQETGRTGIPEPSDPAWCQWRRDRVTDLVRQVYEGVQQTKPHVRVTASVVASGECTTDFKKTRAYTLLLQDWERWLREGIIDAVIPMNYKSERRPEDAKLFRDWTSGMVKWKHGRQVYNGCLTRDADGFIAQIQESRARRTDGVCGFAFTNEGNREALASKLRMQVYPTWVPTPPMMWKPPHPSEETGKPPDAKRLFDEAIYYASKGNELDKAIDLLKKAVEADANFAEAHFRLGRCYLRKGMKDEAAAKFRDTLEINARHGGAMTELRRLEKGG